MFNTVKCRKCKHIVSKQEAYKVKTTGLFGDRSTEYFCLEHNPLYDEEHETLWGVVYYRRMKVDGTGTPIGYEEKPKTALKETPKKKTTSKRGRPKGSKNKTV